MSKLLQILVCILLCNCNSVAQSSSRHSAYIEFGGAGYYGSLNYSYELFAFDHFSMSPRVGIGSHRLNDFTGHFNPHFVAPLGVHFRTLQRLYADFGFGMVLSSTVQSVDNQKKRVTALGGFASLGCGYRFKNRLFLRLAYTPLVTSEQRFVNWAGISFGYQF